jgi:hypothetical protein
MAPNNSLYRKSSSSNAQKLHGPSLSHSRNNQEATNQEATNELHGFLDSLIFSMQTYQMEYDIEDVRF